MGGITVAAGKCEECDVHRRLFLRRLPIYIGLGLAIYVGYRVVRSK